MAVSLIDFKKWIRVVVCSLVFCFLVSGFLFSIFYFISDYQSLKQWYLSLGDCFYNHNSWDSKFFSQGVKTAGNYFAIAGATLSALAMVYIISRWKKVITSHLSFPVFKGAAIFYVIIFALAVVINLWGNNIAAPAYDEIFSAVNCAELHPFQTISYYMLPNNHLYFNLINGALFGWCHHLIQSGRLISFIAYAGVLFSAFKFFYKLVGNKLSALLIILPLSLQFIIWAFSFQARGYELQLLAGWIAGITIFTYTLNQTKDLLWVNTLANILGFVLIPSYLFFYIAQVLFVITQNIKSRKLDTFFFKHQLVCGLFVFLCYLPALCFSGIASFTANKYVKPVADSWHSFLPDFINVFKYYLNSCFSVNNNYVCFFLFVLPLVLLFSKRRGHRLLALFYSMLWVVFIFLCLIMRHAPFHRNLIIHFSITGAMIIYTSYFVIENLSNRLFKGNAGRIFKYSSFTVIIISLSLFLLKYDKDHISDLYGNSLNETYKEHTEEVKIFPQHSTIAFSDESFYFFYLCRNDDLIVSRCPNGSEDYYVKRTDELLPVDIESKYLLYKKCSEDYEIYKRK